MLDTNAFDALLFGDLTFDPADAPRLIATSAQHHEIAAIPINKGEKRTALLGLIADVEIIPAGEFSFGVDGLGFGQAEWADATFLAMLQHHQTGERKSKEMLANQLRDVGIAWASLKRGAILISGDRQLIATLKAFGGAARDFRSPSPIEPPEIPVVRSLVSSATKMTKWTEHPKTD